MLLPLFIFGLTIKFASIAPEGSYWHDLIMKIKKDLETSDTKIFIYSGTSMGDEVDIVKKIRLKQLHAAGLTSHGLELISPEIRAYDLPLIFNSYEEFFAVRDRLFPTLQRVYDEKGYKLLSHFTIGFVHIFSSRKEGPWDGNLWIWIGDTLAEAEANEMAQMFRIIPLQIGDVLQALATGMVDTVLNAFYALHALQWSNFIKSYVPLPLYIYSGCLIIRKDIWEQVDENIRIRAEKEIWNKAMEMEKDIVSLNEETKKKIEKRLRKADEPQKIEELKKIMVRVKERVLKQNPEIKAYYEIIEKTLAEIRREDVKN